MQTAGAAHAQLYTKARTLTTANGLSDNSINCFYKDSRGYMWIGTRHGLNQYDGHSFNIFKPGPANSISNEVINAIAGSPDGDIWVATMNGLNCYNPAQKKWTTIMPGNSKLPNNLVWDIQFNKDGLLWIASDVFEFSSYNTHSKKFTYYDWPKFAKTIPANNNSKYTSILKFTASPGGFYLGTTRGLVHLDIETGRFKWLGAGFTEGVLDVRYDGSTRKVYLSANEGKCFVYDENDSSYRQLNIETENYPSTFVVSNRTQELWLPASTGLLRANDKNAHLAQHVPNFSSSLLPGAVRTVYKDNTGIRWVGTSNGVAIYDAGKAATFIPLLPISDKAASNTMGGLCFDTRSNSYFVCSLTPAAVFIVPVTGGAIRKITTDAAGKPLSACNNIVTDNTGNPWLLTDHHAYRFDYERQAFVEFSTPNKSANVGFREFVQDNKGDYWFGTFLQGIYHYNITKRQFDSIPFIFLPFTKKVGSLCYDSLHRNIWISAYSSDVIRYDLSNSTMEGYEDRPGLSSLNMTNDIITARGGNTWVATESNGLFRFNHNRTIDHFDMRTGLPGNRFTSLCEDAQQRIWSLSERGIDVIDTTGKLLESINAFDFSSYTSDTRSAHTLLFNKQTQDVAVAVGGGLCLVPTVASEANRPFNVTLTSILIGNRDTMFEQSNHLSHTSHSSNTSQFRFAFAGLYYGPPQTVLYEYKLSGYDQHWVRATDFTASYQNLPTGNYYFQVRARYKNGPLAGESPVYSFKIIPPFWRTPWFIIIISLVVIGALAWLVYSMQQKLNTEKILRAFTSSLYLQNTIEDISWDTARNCVLLLGFTDCVIYWYDEERRLLVQKAAYGPKNPYQREIYNSIAIPLGKGIVGSVALKGKLEVIKDTSKDERYIVDDEQRLSEICIPIFIEGKLFGVIDSEHPQKNFYTRYQVQLLKKMTAICAERIARYQAEEKLRACIARDLHDEMGSTLTSINIMSKVAMEGMPDKTPAKDYLQKIKDNSVRILESMGDMVWVINPANDNFEKLLFRMKEFAAEMLEPLRINYQFIEEGILHAIHLNVEQRKELYMIFKEAITNAVKYSDATELTITVKEQNGMLVMEIADKGTGFDPGLAIHGNGLKNMKARAAQIGATFSIETAKNSGSHIILHLPLLG